MKLQLQALEKLSEKERKQLDDYCISHNFPIVDQDGNIDPLAVIILCIQGNVEIMNLIIRAGIDMDNYFTFILVHHAVYYSNKEILEILISAGADVTKEILICTAVEDQNWDIAKLLINNGADVTVLNNKPLQCAFENKDTYGISILLEAGAKIPNEWTLKYFQAKDDFEMLDMILDNYIYFCRNKINVLIAKIIKKLIKHLK